MGGLTPYPVDLGGLRWTCRPLKTVWTRQRLWWSLVDGQRCDGTTSAIAPHTLPEPTCAWLPTGSDLSISSESPSEVRPSCWRHRLTPFRFVRYRIVAVPAPQSLDDRRTRTATELLPAGGADTHPQARVTKKDLTYFRAHGAVELWRFAFSATPTKLRFRPSRPTQTPM